MSTKLTATQRREVVVCITPEGAALQATSCLSSGIRTVTLVHDHLVYAQHSQQEVVAKRSCCSTATLRVAVALLSSADVSTRTLLVQQKSAESLKL
jgi:hypothetical protein